MSTWILTIAAIDVFISLIVDRCVLQGLERFRQYNVNAIFESTVRLTGAVALLAIRRTAPMALVSYVGGLLCAKVLLSRQLRRRWFGLEPPPADLTEIWRFAAPMLVLMIAFATQTNADILAAKRGLPPKLAGA